MSPRALKALAAALLGLGLLWAFLLLRERRAPAPARLWTAARDAGRLWIQRPGAKDVSLVRHEAAWRLEAPFAYPADAGAVQDLLDKLSRVSVSEPVSSSPERRAAFGLEGPALRLRGFILPTDAEPALDVWVGVQGADADSFFFRPPAADAVREARGLPRGELEREAGEWAERLLCSISTPALRGVWVRRKGALPAGVLRDEAVQAALARFQADRVVPESEADPRTLRALADPWLRLEVRYAERPGPASPETTLEAAFGPKTADFSHYARVKGREGVLFKLSAWKLAPFLDAAKPGR